MSNNLVADTLVEGGGLHAGNRFAAVPLSGGVMFAGSAVLRRGSFDPNWRVGVGATWFYAKDAPVRADIVVADTLVLAPTLEAITTVGNADLIDQARSLPSDPCEPTEDRAACPYTPDLRDRNRTQISPRSQEA